MYYNGGGVAIGGAHLIADARTSSDNRELGYRAEGQGSLVELTGCISFDDISCCSALHGAQLPAQNVSVTKSQLVGFFAHYSGKLVLRQCVATNCKDHGVDILYPSMQWV